MNNNDYYLAAVAAMEGANKKLKLFAECCYHVSDRQTLALALDCKCSVDTVENYRRAYYLYTVLGGDDSEPARQVWEHAPAALWVKAAQLWTRLELSPEKVFEYLETASEEGMTREQMAAVVDEKENHTPKWVRGIRHAIRFLTSSKNSWKTELPMDVRTRYDKAVDNFTKELQAIAESIQAS